MSTEIYDKLLNEFISNAVNPINTVKSGSSSNLHTQKNNILTTDSTNKDAKIKSITNKNINSINNINNRFVDILAMDNFNKFYLSAYINMLNSVTSNTHNNTGKSINSNSNKNCIKNTINSSTNTNNSNNSKLQSKKHLPYNSTKYIVKYKSNKFNKYNSLNNFNNLHTISNNLYSHSNNLNSQSNINDMRLEKITPYLAKKITKGIINIESII